MFTYLDCDYVQTNSFVTKKNEAVDFLITNVWLHREKNVN